MNSNSLTLVLGILMVIVSLAILLAGPPNRLEEFQLIDYIRKRKFTPVDVILVPPFVMDGENNLSLVSVLRFMPWIRRIHLQDYKHNEDPIEYWKQHQHSKLILFSSDLRTYVHSSPFLVDQFVVLQPLYVLSNYTFMWQFFIRDVPVVRSCKHAGIVPYVRARYGEVGAHYLDNPDRFIPPCSTSLIKTVTYASPVYDPNKIKALLHFNEIHKDRESRPVQIVLCVVNSTNEDVILGDPFSSSIQVWVRTIKKNDNAHQRLSFIHRMIVQHHAFIEVPHTDNEEAMGAEIMKQLRSMSNGMEFKIKAVCAVTPNTLATKLARVYETTVTELSSIANKNLPEETKRLAAL